MDTLSFKTVSANKATVTKEWVVVDASGQSLGRVCSKIAKLLRGKYKPNFTPHVDCGDNVIVINADKVVLTGKKWDDRVYLKNRLGAAILANLYVYDGAEHKHEAQQPRLIDLNTLK